MIDWIMEKFGYIHKAHANALSTALNNQNNRVEELLKEIDDIRKREQ